MGDEVKKVTSTRWLLDNLCGPHNMTAAFDLKHIWKRYRTLLISTSRSSLILGDCLTRADLQVLLTAAGYDSSAIQSMFNPVDKQNVPSACKLLKAVADLVDVLDIAVSSTMLPQLVRARLFGHIVCGLLAPVVELDASISDLLVKISKSTHILFVCFRAAGSKFIPTVLYHDTQAFVQTVFWNIIKLQVFGQEQAYHIHQQGTDSGENLFGHMRTLTHNSNFNVAEANTNISTAHQIHKILEHHPEWSRGHKQLKATEDHVNPHSWRGSMFVHKGLDVPALYRLGQAEAKAAIITLELMPKECLELDFYHLHIGNTRCHVTSLTDEKPEQVEASAHEPDTNDEEYVRNGDHSDDHDNDGIQGCVSMNDFSSMILQKRIQHLPSRKFAQRQQLYTNTPTPLT